MLSLFPSAHSQIMSAATMLLHHFGHVCVPILDYAAYIFHTADKKIHHF